MGLGERRGGGAGGMSDDAIDESLARIAEWGDPTARVYEALYAADPALAALFGNDESGAVRGHMLYEALEVARDLAGARAYGAHFLAAESVNHENLSVSRAAFATFYDAIIAAFAEILGPAWTTDFAAAWARVRDEAAALAARQIIPGN